MLEQIPVHLIDPSPDQNREHFERAELEQLAASIAELGLIQPVKVRAAGDRFTLVAGERRLRAVRDVLELETIAAIVTPAEDGDAALGTLAENLLRVDPSPLEEAGGYRRVIDAYAYTAADVARRVGVPADRVRRRLGLLELAEEVTHYLRSGQLPVGRAEMMVGLDSNRQHLALAAHHEQIPTETFRKLVARLADEQAAESMFDADNFLAVDEYVAEAEAELEAESIVTETKVREIPLGVNELAERFGVKAATVHQWQHRGILPPADLKVTGTPLWWPATIDAWALETGRSAA